MRSDQSPKLKVFVCPQAFAFTTVNRVVMLAATIAAFAAAERCRPFRLQNALRGRLVLIVIILA